MNDDAWSLENFTGTARLFPLPNLVLFPHVVQPLHIFEPRYRAMTADALAGDRLIAMCLLRAGAAASAERPPIHPVACLGRIVADKMLEDGRYLLLLRGLSRVRVEEEVEDGSPFRIARVALLHDVLDEAPAELSLLRKRLADLILPRFTGAGGDKQQLRDLFEGEMPLGALCDCLCYQLPLPLPRKQELLEECNVAGRARDLLTTLQSLLLPAGLAAGEGGRKFPPDFSLN